jgi:outer membrane protein assembly factor BamB
MDRTPRHLLALVVIAAIVTASIATAITAPFSVVAQNTISEYGGTIEADTTAGAIFSIADGSILTKAESITFRAHFSGPPNWLVLPGGGLCNVIYKASWETQSRTIYHWSYNSPDIWEDDDPNPQSVFSYTVDLKNVPIGPQQIEVTASGVGYTTDVSRWYLYTGSGSSLIHFIVAADPPAIDVVSPENKEYNTNSIPLIFYTKEETPWLGYSLDNTANVTINGNTTLTGLSDGYHSIAVYANGTKWNAGKSSDVLFKVNAQPGGNTSIPTSFWKTNVMWNLSETPARDQWEIDIQFKSRSWTTPAVYDGKVYAGAMFRVYVNQYRTYEWVEVHAFDATNGAEIWRYQDDSSREIATPAVSNGVVYIATDQHIYALRASDGSLIWNYSTGMFHSNPVVVQDLLFIGGASLHALSATNGHSIWNYTAEDGALYSPFIANGVVYVGSSDWNIYALDASTGDKIWESYAGDIILNPTVVKGVVFAPLIGGANIYAFNASDGVKIWNYSVATEWVEGVAVRNDVLYASYGVAPAQLYALNAKDGTKLWSVTLGSEVTPPKIVDDVVCLSSDASLLILSADSGEMLWNWTMGVGLGEPVVVNGVAYLGAGDQIYAIGFPPAWRPESEPFPVLPLVAAVSIIVVCAGLLFYFKKRSR